MVVTVMLTFYLASWYKVTKENDTTVSVLEKTLLNIKITDLDSYLIESPDINIYILRVLDKDTKKVEKKLKKYVIDNQLKDEIIFMDIREYTEAEINQLKAKLSEELKTINFETNSNILTFSDRKITNAVYKELTEVNYDDFKTYIDENVILYD